jgi:NAD(P)-dependent dehydrogenase (short-subunit alcohol dehydrogenase family)
MEARKINFRLDGKVALITGAGRGIGAVCAEILSQAGARVVISDILDEKGKSVAAGIVRSGKEAIYHHLDVTREEQWVSAIETTVQTFGGFDILVNNAAVVSVALMENITLKEWRRVMSINADAVFLGTKNAILAMKPGGIAGKGGSIINFSSVSGIVGFYAGGAYCASKGAVRLLTKAAAIECGKLRYGIRVNSVHPGTTRTEMVEECVSDSVRTGMVSTQEEGFAQFVDMHPIGRVAEPAEIAHAVLYLASDASGFVTGSELVIDGGFTAQ